jgi:hypothetical protein
MWKTGATAGVLLLGLGACASSNGAPYLQSPGGAGTANAAVAKMPDSGWLEVEPFAIYFKNGKSAAQPVRVWQPGFSGHFRVRNHCPGIVVTLVRYTPRNASLWKVGPDAPGRRSCSIAFAGGHGSRGTGFLKIRVLRNASN